jgi:hypothetical protein
LTVGWDAVNKADNSSVQFSVTLFDDGNIEFHYGAGNTNLTPTVGISGGDGRNYRLASYDGAASLNDALPIRFALAPGFVDIGAYEFRGNSNDVLPPTAVATFPTTIQTNGVVTTPVNEIRLTFNEELNPIGARSPAAYELRSAGTNAVFGSRVVLARLFTFTEKMFDPALFNHGPTALCDFKIVFPFVAAH